jgi:hypothetical protein
MKKAIFILTAAIITMGACKKDESGDTVYLNNGSVTGTISGIKQDNSTINEKFTFNQYLNVLDEQYFYIDPTSQIYNFNIEYRSKDNSYTNLEFTLSSSTDNTPDNINFTVEYYKDYGNSIFHFYMHDNNNNVKNTTTVNDFSFDKSTGRVQCKIATTGLDNSTDKDAKIEAAFDVTLKQLIE